MIDAQPAGLDQIGHGVALPVSSSNHVFLVAFNRRAASQGQCSIDISAEAPGDAYIFVLTFPYRDFFDLFVLHKLSRLHCTAAIRFSIAS
jgi:hypothetical protein